MKRFCASATRKLLTTISRCHSPTSTRIDGMHVLFAYREHLECTLLTTRRPSDDRKEMQSAVVWSCFQFIRSGQNHLARHSERGKKTRQTEEEVGRQHQGIDRSGVRQVPEGSGEQGKWRKLVAKSSVVPKRPSRLRNR